jgi:hypothetical protein
MKRWLLILLLCPALWASTQQIILGGVPGSTLANTSTQYMSIQGFSENSSPATMYGAMPTGGMFTSFTVWIATAPGSGKTWTLCIYKNGACLADSSMTFNGSTNCVTGPCQITNTMTDATVSASSATVGRFTVVFDWLRVPATRCNGERLHEAL